jgi:hypothetical protein
MALPKSISFTDTPPKGRRPPLLLTPLLPPPLPLLPPADEELAALPLPGPSSTFSGLMSP